MMPAWLLKAAVYALAAALLAGGLGLAWSRFTTWVRAPVVEQLEEAKAGLARTTEDLASCGKDRARLEESVAQQNRAIAAWQAEAERRFQEGLARGRAAAAAAQPHFDAAAAELAGPALDQDACASALKRGHRYLERRRASP